MSGGPGSGVENLRKWKHREAVKILDCKSEVPSSNLERLLGQTKGLYFDLPKYFLLSGSLLSTTSSDSTGEKV